MPILVNWFLRLVITNPITVRLVQGGSRRTRHFLIRAGYLAALIVVLLFLLLSTATDSDLSYKGLAIAGASSFEYVAYLQVFLICLLTPIFMAGAIVQESSPRTWDILLTTPLNATQIVLGNLFGRLFFVLALLASSLPLFAITQYFGGVPGRAILLSYLIAGCSALLVGTIAVTLSVTRVGGRRAVFIFYAAVAAYLALTFAVDQIQNISVSPNEVTLMTALNPFLALRVLLSSSSYVLPDPISLGAMGDLQRMWFGRPVQTYCLLTGGLSLILMVYSAVSLRMITARTGATPWYRRAFRLGAADRRTRAPRRVWSNPIAWREAYARTNVTTKVVGRWGFVALAVIAAIAVLWSFHSGGLSIAEFRFTLAAVVGAELAILVLATLNMAAAAVAREREDGTLDLILTTPITPKVYLGGKLQGLFRYLLPMTMAPVLTLMLAGLYVWADGFGRSGGVTIMRTLAGGPGGATLDVPAILPVAAMLTPLLTIPPFIALCVMIGLQWSLKSKGTISSVIATSAVVVVILGVLSLCGGQGGQAIPVVGAILSTISPATMINALLRPLDALGPTVQSGGGLASVEVNLVIGGLITATAYSLIVWGIRSNMVRTFDMTVRKLTGTT
jgi:ABC-type transport system involved in multi-copper enzyme maturation permease subunit